MMSPDVVTRLVRRGVMVSLVAAGIAVVTGILVGKWQAGLALAIGLAIGSINGLLIRPSVRVGFGFTFLSLGRLMVLSLLGIAAGFLFVRPAVWVVLVGMAVAQLVLVGMAAREAVAR